MTNTNDTLARITERTAELRARNEQRRERIVSRQLTRAEALTRQAGAVSNYANATRTRLRPGPIPQGGSAQKHNRTYVRQSLRQDCQDLERNSLVARAMLKRQQAFIVGNGGIVLAASGDEAWDEQATDLFYRWCEGIDWEEIGHPDIRGRLSFWGQLRVAVKAISTDGDVLAVMTNLGSLQWIESERVVSPGLNVQNAAAAGTVDGVQMNKYGQPVRYWVSDWDTTGSSPIGKPISFDARDAVLLTNPMDDKIGMVRGEPALQAAITSIERLDNYIEKTGLAAEIATLFGVLITSSDPGGMQATMEAGLVPQPDRENANQPKQINLEPATAQFLNHGDTITQVKPEYPTTNYRDYVTAQLMLIAADMGLPTVAAFFDASQLSWSNIKALLSINWRDIEVYQDYLAVLVRRVYAWKIRRWIADGVLPPPPVSGRETACEVFMPQAPVVDFKSEADGYKLAVEAGFADNDWVCRQLGTGKAMEILARRAKYIAKARQLGVPVTVTPGSATNPNASTEPVQP